MIGPMINPSFGSDQDIPGIVVTEACETLVNGTYVLTGTHNNQPYWYNGDTYLYYDSSGYWCIDGTLGTVFTSALYVVQNTGPWPPENYSWESKTGCTPGLPSLRYIWIVPGPEPSTCPDADPEMVVTVTGATGTINWCGETWVLPGDSGVAKTVCPTTYEKEKHTTVAVPGAKFAFLAQHVWANTSGTYDEQLGLTRNYHVQYFYYKWRYQGLNRNNLHVGPERDSRTFGVKFSSRPATGGFYPTPGTLYSDIDKILAVPAPYYTGNYSLTSQFFGSHIVGGITYAWAKGNGWPE